MLQAMVDSVGESLSVRPLAFFVMSSTASPEEAMRAAQLQAPTTQPCLSPHHRLRVCHMLDQPTVLVLLCQPTACVSTTACTTPEMMTKDLRKAKEFRESFIEYLEDIGVGLAAGRLARECPESYPTVDDIGHLARMLGGTIALQVNDQQVFYGSGKLVHICYCAAIDGQPEYNGVGSIESHNSIADSATSPGTDTEEHWARLILEYEAEVSRLNLKISGVRVQLAFAKRRYRQQVLRRRVDGLGFIPLPPGVAKLPKKTIQRHPLHRVALLTMALQSRHMARTLRDVPTPQGICKACRREPCTLRNSQE